MSKILEYKEQIDKLENELANLDPNSNEFKNLEEELEKIKEEAKNNVTNWDKVTIARSLERLKSKTLIDELFSDFVELHGDQYYSDDQSIISGIAYLKDMPVTVLAQAKGRDIQESIKRNFGMTSPEGFRKTLRLAKQAEKFHRPIITIVDTSGAYPGKGAEERGQSRAIAQNLLEFSKLKTPVISIILSEGGSGGALALTIGDYIYMFENAVYSVLSPEGLATILFKGNKTAEDAANVMKLTAEDLVEYNIVDEIIKEPYGGIKKLDETFVNNLKDTLYNKLQELKKKDLDTLLDDRYAKFRKVGI